MGWDSDIRPNGLIQSPMEDIRRLVRSSGQSLSFTGLIFAAIQLSLTSFCVSAGELAEPHRRGLRPNGVQVAGVSVA